MIYKKNLAVLILIFIFFVSKSSYSDEVFEKGKEIFLNDGNCASCHTLSDAKSIANIGPISVALDAEGDFQMYSSGIFTSTECSSDMLDHAVLAIGYGVSANGTKYLMIKNSWGTDWGMDGYIYFSADIPNMCGVASVASYPIV